MEHELNSLFGHFSIFPMICLDLVATFEYSITKEVVLQ